MVSKKAITIFTTPKPFRGHINIIQRNAIRSWTLLRPKPLIVLFGDEEGAAETAREFKVKHVPDVRCSDLGTPLVSDVFGQAERLARGRIMLYTNADMMYAQSLVDGLQSAVKSLDRWLVLGQRWDVDIAEELALDDGGVELDDLVKSRGIKHSPSGMDYWGFPKHLWGPLPDFVIGRAAWDGAMLSRTLHAKIPVVDATLYIVAIHQNHDYSHIKGGWQGAWEGEEAAQNKELAEPLPWIIDLFYADHIMGVTGAVQKKSYAPPLPDRSVNDPGIFTPRPEAPGQPLPPRPAPRPIPQPRRPRRRTLAARRAARPPAPPPVAKPPPEPVKIREMVVPLPVTVSAKASPAESPSPPAPWPPVAERAEKHLEMTIFSCPKPFQGHFGMIQYNAIGSWCMLKPRPEIILLGDEVGTAAVPEKLTVRHIPEIEHSPSGAPLASSMFASIEREGHGLVSAMINADIIVTQSFWDVTSRVYSTLESDFLIIGRRWCLDVTAPISFTRGNWWRTLRRNCQSSGRLDHPDALDYFIFSHDLYEDIPPLAIGRAAIDGALIALALEKEVPVIDATDVIFVVHQNHDYSHVAGGKDEVWNGPDAQKNRELVPNWAKTINHATHKMTAGGLFKR